MPANAKTHEENRLKICLVCFSKGSRVSKVTGTNLRRIKEYFLENYDPTEDVRLPAGICTRCEKLLFRIEKGENTVESLPQPYDFSKITPVVARTRADPSRLCACALCSVARSNPFTLGVGKAYSALVKPQRGRPSEPEPSTSATSENFLLSPGPMVICKRCWQPIGRGIPHPSPCTVKDAQQNLVENLKQVPQAAEIAASDVLKQKFKTSTGSSINIRTRGKDLKIKRPLKSAFKALFSSRYVSPEEVNRFQSTLGLSLKQTEKALVFFRSWKGRDSVQSGVMGALRDADKELESYYSVAKLSLDSSVKGGAEVSRSVVFCHDIRGLIDNVIEQRGGSIADYMIKIGIDGGGNFLKFTMNVIKEDTMVSDSKRMKYSEGAFAKNFVDGGVKKLLLIGIVEQVKETYHNLESVLKLIGLDRIDFFCAFDLKLANAFLGIGTHSSSFPCPWCEIPKSSFSDPDRIIELRTLGSIRDNAMMFQAALVNHKRKAKLSAADYKSCQNVPLLKNLPDDTVVLDVIPVMELHLVLGIVNRLYDHLDATLCSIEGCELRAIDWSNKLCIKRPPQHGVENNARNSSKTSIF